LPVELPALLSVKLPDRQLVESLVQQPGQQPVEPRDELPGRESGGLWVELLVKRPPDGLT